MLDDVMCDDVGCGSVGGMEGRCNEVCDNWVLNYEHSICVINVVTQYIYIYIYI